MRLIAVLSAFALAAPLIAQGTPAPAPGARMAADAHTSFAAAVIKPHDPNSPCGGCAGVNTQGHRMTILNKSVSSIMQMAYAINPRQVIGAPDWFFHDTFDIEGTTDIAGEPSRSQWQDMLQNLLANRYSLRFHREKRDLPAYAIRIVKGGPRVKPAARDEQPDIDDNGDGQVRTVTLTSASLDEFATRMQLFVDRPVVDETHLIGRYDFALRYTIDETRTTDPGAPPGLFTSIQEQLGLKLQPVKATVDVFVIDHVERPSEN